MTGSRPPRRRAERPPPPKTSPGAPSPQLIHHLSVPLWRSAENSSELTKFFHQLPGRCLTRLPLVNRLPQSDSVRVRDYIGRSIAANERRRSTLRAYLIVRLNGRSLSPMARAGGFKPPAAAPSKCERRLSRLSLPRKLLSNLLKINDLQKKFRFFQKGVDSAETLNYVLAPRRRSLIDGGPRGSGKRRAV